MTIFPKLNSVFEQGEGIFRMIPCWVPRKFNQAGQRLRLHPDDYYAFGTERGAIKERWFSSVVAADNGPRAAWDEGMSYIALNNNPREKYLFRYAVQELGATVIGAELWEKYHDWPMYSKFFDYKLPLFHHLHLDDAAAQRIGRLGKPEAYYFPVQMNTSLGEFPLTYFGFDPDLMPPDPDFKPPARARKMVREYLLDYEKRDTRLTEIARAYRLKLGTGWYIPAGVLHAPGSLCTYEPQWNSDVASVFENVTSGEVFGRDSLVGNLPDDQKDDVEKLLDLVDWEINVDPHFAAKYFRPPVPIPQTDSGFSESWITYDAKWFSAKELRVAPGASVTVKDKAAYGCIIVQGHGTFGRHNAETAILLRFDQLSADEFFVSEKAAQSGVVVSNHSRTEPMVILKHFGPNNPHKTV
jgi:hypothetical protein